MIADSFRMPRRFLRGSYARLTLTVLALACGVAQVGADDLAGQTLLDADLAILAADELLYDAYAEAIRREYAWVPEGDYRAGRVRVLERFLARPRIFFTPPMAEAETRACDNLAREIGRLRL